VWKTLNNPCFSPICDKLWILSVWQDPARERFWCPTLTTEFSLMLSQTSYLWFVLTVHFHVTTQRGPGLGASCLFSLPCNNFTRSVQRFSIDLYIVKRLAIGAWGVVDQSNITRPSILTYSWLFLEKKNLMCQNNTSVISRKLKGGEFQGWTFFNFSTDILIVQLKVPTLIHNSLKRNNNGCQKEKEISVIQ